MKTKTGKEANGMKLWKRNAVVAAIVLFVGVAVYLNWSYAKQGENADEAGKTLGQAALVDGKTEDPLVGDGKGEASPSPTETGTADGTKGTASGYFDLARLNRQEARDTALALLEDTVSNEKADQEAKNAANLSIQAMADYTVTEAQIENLVMAKGYADCVAFINDESISVVVPAKEEGLTETDTARITDIVTSETGFTPNQINIIMAD